MHALQTIFPKGTLLGVKGGRLGHAVLCAKPIVGDAPFAVLLGDDLYRTDASKRSGIGQLIDAYEETGKGQIALMQVPLSEIHKYGAAEGKADEKDRKSVV